MVRKIIIFFSLILGFSLIVFYVSQRLVSPRLFTAQISPGPNEAVFELSPSSGTFNSNFSVNLMINASAGITSVKTYLNFNPSYVRVGSLDFTNSVFGAQWEKTFDNTA